MSGDAAAAAVDLITFAELLEDAVGVVAVDYADDASADAAMDGVVVVVDDAAAYAADFAVTA